MEPRRKRSPKAGVWMEPFFLEEGVEIDICPMTKGIWLDLGELSVLLGLEVDRPCRTQHGQLQRLIVRHAFEIDHEHEERDQLKDHVQNGREVRLGAFGRLGGHDSSTPFSPGPTGRAN